MEAPNKEESRQSTKPVGPCAFVIFGITGDLTSRLLFPALYNLAHSKLLPEEFAVAGFSSSDLNELQLRDKLAMGLRQAIGTEADPEIIQWLVSRVRFVQSDFQSPSGWQQLDDLLARLDQDYHTFRSNQASLPQPDRLVTTIQPADSTSFEFEAKVPGPAIETCQVKMHFDYRDYFGIEHQTGYETLLYDAMVGDSSLFKREDMIEAGWAIVQPILEAWSAGRGGELYKYPAGTNVPSAADQLLARDGRHWGEI
jgi:glucose-6-phosphate 1-dehydrogenase